MLVYSALGLQSVINGGGPISPSRILISAAQFPAGVSPGGMDFWPPDNTLLVTTANGMVTAIQLHAVYGNTRTRTSRPGSATASSRSRPGWKAVSPSPSWRTTTEARS